MKMPDPMKVLCVCGLGMGSSLILHMTVETAINRMGMNAEIDHTDLSSARSMGPDVVVGQGMHTDELGGIAPVVVSVDDFLDDAAVEEKLRAAFAEVGWGAC
jgi:phosphotransferase system lactose/cellobiose-specific IIB subunit